MPKVLAEYKSPPHKVLLFLKQSRDQLREKYRTLREQLRKAENQVRAVTLSRDQWRQRACAAEAELKKSSQRLLPSR